MSDVPIRDADDMTERPCCELCGDPMPPGEEMFKYHGYSGPCPKQPKQVTRPKSSWELRCEQAERDLAAARAEIELLRTDLREGLENAKLAVDQAHRDRNESVRLVNARLEEAERSLYLKLNEAERERDEARAALLQVQGAMTRTLEEIRANAVTAQREYDQLLALLQECRPWVARGLGDHPAPTPEDERLIARLDAALGGRE